MIAKWLYKLQKTNKTDIAIFLFIVLIISLSNSNIQIQASFINMLKGFNIQFGMKIEGG